MPKKKKRKSGEKRQFMRAEVPPGWKDRLRAIWEKKGSDESQTVRDALYEYLEKNETKIVPVVNQNDIPQIKKGSEGQRQAGPSSEEIRK